jgi:hypothetical protein
MIGPLSLGQWIYLIALALLFAARGASFPALVFLGNAAATLAVCLAMDLRLLDRTEATLFMMLVDIASFIVMVSSPGLPRLLSIGYAITVPVYAANVFFSLSEGATFAVVITIGVIQIVVAGIGLGGDAGGGHRRPAWLLAPMALPERDFRHGAGYQAQGRLHLSANQRVVPKTGVGHGQGR